MVTGLWCHPNLPVITPDTSLATVIALVHTYDLADDLAPGSKIESARFGPILEHRLKYIITDICQMTFILRVICPYRHVFSLFSHVLRRIDVAEDAR